MQEGDETVWGLGEASVFREGESYNLADDLYMYFHALWGMNGRRMSYYGVKMWDSD